MNEVLGEVTFLAGDFTHPLMEKRDVKKRCVIVVGTDKGLCGALNSNLFRLVAEFMRRQRVSGQRVVIYGAGDAAGLVMREVLSTGHDIRILGFIDDDPRKAGGRVSGYAVLGGYSALTILLKAASVDAVVISARRMPPERLNNLEVLCSENNVQLSRLRVDLEPIVSIDTEDSKTHSRAHLRQIGS